MRRRFMNKSGGVKELPYLTIEALEDGLTAKLSTNACKYSTDGVTWTDLAAGTTTPAINKGKKLYFKATGLTPTSDGGIGTFTVSKQFNLSGNCMSMLFGDAGQSNFYLTGYTFAFYRLFYNCNTLKSVSAGFLPATTLGTLCYAHMFENCSRLTTAPELPAIILTSQCYYRMFENCSSLTTAPELPATTLAGGCYQYMFSGCTKLTTAPEILPATTLTGNCYQGMFENCSRLTTAPELPATILEYRCYNYMFENCRSLTIAPELPATTLKNYCYQYMFYGCTGLTTAPELPATTLSSNCYDMMFYGTNVLPDCTNIDFSSSTVVRSGGLAGLFAGTVVTDSDLINILPINPNTGNYWLPVTTLASDCYQYMFYDCTGLTTAPELPATTLSSNCYYSMFYGCNRLTTAPELPATTLAYNCYNGILYGTNVLPDCTNIDFSSSTVVRSGGLAGLFAGTVVTDSDLINILPINPNTGNYWLPVTTLASNCYRSMFYGCNRLTTAPELPATTLSSDCYYRMFYNCKKLNYIKAMFTTKPSSSYTSNWVYGVASTGTFVKNTTATWDVTGVNGVPSRWTITTETEGVKMIEFTISSTSYQAEEGMTWGEWVESEYNTGNFFNFEGNIKVLGVTNTYVFNNSGNYVQSSDIISETNYITDSGGTN